MRGCRLKLNATNTASQLLWRRRAGMEPPPVGCAWLLMVRVSVLAGSTAETPETTETAG